jgi:uncharacterized protein (TIGR02266 family)
MDASLKRETPRIHCDARVDYGSTTEVVLDHKLENLSLGGACLRVSFGQPVGTPITLFISIPGDEDPIKVDGIVVWSNDTEPRDVGIRFVRLSPEDLQRLKRYVEVHLDAEEP